MIKKLLTIFALVLFFALPHNAGATAFYVDFTCATDGAGATSICGNGTASTTPFSSLDQFTEVARSAGDLCIVKRGVASTTNVSTLDFTSDGTEPSPIGCTSDYDNIFNNFATSSATYTVAVASSTFVGNGASDVVAGEWVYIEGDCSETYNSTTVNPCEFAYEVASVAGNVVNLRFPYLGNQSGSGKNLRRMPSNPQWNAVTGDFTVNFGTDNFWFMKGISFYGTNAGGQLAVATSIGLQFIDCDFKGNGTGDVGLDTSGPPSSMMFNKVWFADDNNVIWNTDGASDSQDQFVVKNMLVTPSGGTSGFEFGMGDIVTMENVYIFNVTTAFTLTVSTGSTAYQVNLRNIQFTGVTTRYTVPTTAYLDNISVEDDAGTIGLNKSFQFTTTANTNTLQSTTTSTASGGTKTLEYLGSTDISTMSERKIKLFDYPITTDTSSKTYTVYFQSPNGSWTANPTNQELWIECDYWAHATNATSTRKVKKSTGTLNFTGSTAEQSLAVTCQPSQSGITYLRGWYAKTKEAGKTNNFIVGLKPVIN